MNLAELRPQKSTFKLSTIKQELVMNPITLSDEVWLSQQYSQERIQQIFNHVDLNEISRIVFRLLDIDSKKLFRKQKVEFVTEDGDVLEKELGGVDLLRNACVGADDKLALLNAIIDNLGLSRPEVDEEDSKKKTTAK